MIVKDSFGNEVAVGDYVYFQVKTRHVGALSVGRITKITPKGGVSMVTLCTNGVPLEAFIQSKRDYRERVAKSYTDAGKPLPNWVSKLDTITSTTQLRDASSCVRIPAQVLPPAITQALSGD